MSWGNTFWRLSFIVVSILAIATVMTISKNNLPEFIKTDVSITDISERTDDELIQLVLAQATGQQQQDVCSCTKMDIKEKGNTDPNLKFSPPTRCPVPNGSPTALGEGGEGSGNDATIKERYCFEVHATLTSSKGNSQSYAPAGTPTQTPLYGPLGGATPPQRGNGGTTPPIGNELGSGIGGGVTPSGGDCTSEQLVKSTMTKTFRPATAGAQPVTQRFCIGYLSPSDMGYLSPTAPPGTTDYTNTPRPQFIQVNPQGQAILPAGYTPPTILGYSFPLVYCADGTEYVFDAYTGNEPKSSTQGSGWLIYEKKKNLIHWIDNPQQVTESSENLLTLERTDKFFAKVSGQRSCQCTFTVKLFIEYNPSGSLKSRSASLTDVQCS